MRKENFLIKSVVNILSNEHCFGEIQTMKLPKSCACFLCLVCGILSKDKFSFSDFG